MKRLAFVSLFLAACGGPDTPDPSSPDAPTSGVDAAEPPATPGTFLDSAEVNSPYAWTLDAARGFVQLGNGVFHGDTLVASGTVLRDELDGNFAVATQPPNQTVAYPPRYCRFDLTTGETDATWGEGGCVDAPLAYFAAKGIVKVPDGYRAIVQANCTNGCPPERESFGLVKISASGVLDVTFGTEGILYSTVLPDLSALAFAAKSNGDIVISGYTGLYNMKLFAIHPDGSLDTTFGTNGFVTGANGGRVRVLADDSILLESTYNGTERIDHLTANGQAIWGADIEQLTQSGFDNDLNTRAAEIDAQGRVLVAYNRRDAEDAPMRAAVLRLLPTGAIDPTFHTNLGDNVKEISGLGFEPDGRIVFGAQVDLRYAIGHLAP